MRGTIGLGAEATRRRSPMSTRRPHGRAADRPSFRLQGVLQVDGYAGYRALANKGDVTLAFCWAHLRRRFYERVVAEASPIANEALQRIAALYRIETDIRRCAPDARGAGRPSEARPIVAELEPWLREKLALLSRKSKLVQAIRYGLSTLGRSRPFPRRRAGRDRLQYSRAIDPADCNDQVILRPFFKCL